MTVLRNWSEAISASASRTSTWPFLAGSNNGIDIFGPPTISHWFKRPPSEALVLPPDPVSAIEGRRSSRAWPTRL